MFLDWSAVRIFVRPRATDLRKQINGLAAMAQGEINLQKERNHRIEHQNKALEYFEEPQLM